MRPVNPLAAAALIVAGLAATSALHAHARADSSQPPADENLPLLEGDQRATVTEQNTGREFRFVFGGGYTSSFKSDLDTGGEISVDRLTGGLNVATDLGSDLTLDCRLNFGVASYDFSGDSGIGGGFGGLDPWDDINNVGFGFAIAWDVNDDWTVFAGPVFQFTGESGADWGDSFNFGAIAGVTYRVHDKLVVGGGLSVTSQIEDSIRVFPLIIIQWQFADNWRISNVGPSGGRSSIELTGIELVWTPFEKWEFGLGAGSSYSRFRLEDDNDVAPDGVGQDESTPVWLRASWRPNSTFNIEALAGLAFGGEVSLDDSNGDGLAKSDYDAPLFVGLFGSIRF